MDKTRATWISTLASKYKKQRSAPRPKTAKEPERRELGLADRYDKVEIRSRGELLEEQQDMMPGGHIWKQPRRYEDA